MTINTIDPAVPDPNDVAGQGDDELRALKQIIVDTFPQAPVATPLDPWDIVLSVGPRALDDVINKATNADLAALDVRVGVTELAIVNHEGRITANEAAIATFDTPAAILAAAWPVGALYVAADGVSPTTKGIPGTWAVLGDGRFLLGAGSGFGSTGGANSVSLVEANLPQHKHTTISYREDSGVNVLPSYAYTSPARTFSTVKAGRDQSSSEMAEFNSDSGINLSGSPTAVNVQNAYVTVRFWQRTA